MPSIWSGRPFGPGAPLGRLGVVVKVIVIAVWAAGPAAFGASLFGSIEFRAGPLPSLSEWRQAFERIERERPVYRARDRSRSRGEVTTARVGDRLAKAVTS